MQTTEQKHCFLHLFNIEKPTSKLTDLDLAPESAIGFWTSWLADLSRLEHFLHPDHHRYCSSVLCAKSLGLLPVRPSPCGQVQCQHGLQIHQWVSLLSARSTTMGQSTGKRLRILPCCQGDNLALNNSMMRELLVDLRKCVDEPKPVLIDGAAVEMVDSFKVWSNHINSNLSH